MLLNPFKRQENPQTLTVGMAGVKMGDRFLQIACEHGGRLGAVAAKVGLSGRALAVVPDEAAAKRATQGAMAFGVLVDVEVSAVTTLPVEDQAFDVAVVDDTAGAWSSLSEGHRVAAMAEARRALRLGGRIIVICPGTATGLSAMFGKAEPASSAEMTVWLQAAGFRSARDIGDREGLLFIEAVRPRA